MNSRLLAPALILVGLLLLLAGFAWNTLFPGRAYWSPEQAQAYEDAHLEVHLKSHHRKGPSQTEEQEFAAAKERFDRLSTQLESSRTSQTRSSTILKVIGGIAILTGVAMHFASRQSP